MDNFMSPSKATPGQIRKMADLFATRLGKAGIDKSLFQEVLREKNKFLVDKLIALVVERAEIVKHNVIRSVRDVDYSMNPRELFKATGRKLYVVADVIKTMPRGDEGASIEVVFFKPGKFVIPDDIEKEYEERDLVCVDPYSLAKINLDDPVFADKYPNATLWRDAENKWCCVTFDNSGGERDVYANHCVNDKFSDDLWFGGVRRK